MPIVHYRPFVMSRRFPRGIDRFRREMFGPRHWARQFWTATPPIELDVYEDREDFKVKASVPGVKPEDLDVTIKDNTLTIKAERRSEGEGKDENYLHRERSFGAYKRAVRLPESLNLGEASADYSNGVLTVTFPKFQEPQPDVIKLEVKPPAGNGAETPDEADGS